MGILNVTPDSFAEDTPLVIDTEVDIDAALRRGHDLVDAGADIIDVGGESTRPGALRVSEAEELARVIPVVRQLVSDDVVVSVDTMRASVAQASLEVGATFINDVSGGTADPEMLGVLANTGARCILMHRRGASADMYAQARYDNPTTEVIQELAQRVDAALAAGVAASAIVLDPGLGFAKRAEHNWNLLRNLPMFMSLGFPVLIGASRKRFLGELLADADGMVRGVQDRDIATAAVSALCAQAGVWAVRVHDVLASRDAIAVANAMKGTNSSPAGLGQFDSLGDSAGPVIRITGVEAFGRHGVFAFEREQGQVFKVDAQLRLLSSPMSDDLMETIDYSKVANDIVLNVGAQPCDLIETLAERIAEELLRTYPCRAVSVTVHKPHAPLDMPFTDVAVTVERQQ